ncbi:T9SS type A sorting domain-containing protein [Bacteroidota bacterium]
MKTSAYISSLLLTAFLLTTNTIQAQKRIYVDKDAAGTPDGTSWTDAYTSLAEALYQAAKGDTVWVAEGTYKPERLRDDTYSPTSYLSTFAMPNYIVLLGGFSGVETADTQRDWRANPVILSGDIGAVGQQGDNACHVIFNPDTAFVDGFIIQDGNGENRILDKDYDFGAGIYNDGKLIIHNCIIRNNRCRYGGAMFCNNDSYLEMDRCLVYSNIAIHDSWGGSGETGGVSLQWIDYALITRSTFWENLSEWDNGNWSSNGISTYGTPEAIVNSCVLDGGDKVIGSTLTYSCAPGIAGATNLDTDPLLSDPGSGDFSLQRGSPCINTGDPGYPNDPDGTRADMGAEIYEHDTIDLGVMAFNHWDGGFKTGSQDVTVTLKSFGTETITSASIGWGVDGVEQTPFDWTGSLGLYEEEDSIVIGTFDFSRDYHTLEAWVLSPNGKTDEYTLNDTLEAIQFACDSVLHDTFLLGPSHDYKTFTDAQDALCNCGISGTTTFLIENGVYLEQVTISEIDGAGTSDSIVFRSQSGINQNVVLSWAPQEQAKPWTVKLDSADFITFEKMTIETRDSLFGHAIEIGAGSKNINILNNNIIGDSLSDALIYGNYEGNVDTIKDISILNNYFRFGKTAIGLIKDSWPRMERIRIENNHIEEFNHIAINLRLALAPIIKNNLIRCGAVNTSYEGLVNLIYISDKAIISGNQIYKTEPGGTPYGIKFQNSGSTAGNEMLILNNMISLNGSSYCLAAFQSGGMKIYHNSILAYGTGYSPLYLERDDFYVYNNNVVNLRGGAVANYAYTPTPTCDFNNYFTVSGMLIKNGANEPKTLDAWFSASGQDEHSVNSISGFFDLTDLHTASADLDSAGTPVPEVTVDIDGQSRNATHPDIGASEYEHPGYMHGDWIIGNSDTATFPNIISAFNWMYMLHIDSTTNLLLEPGQYEEQMVLHAVPGATAEMPVTLTSLSGDSSDTWISYKYQSLSKDYVLRLSGARHLHFENLGFRSDSTLKYQGIILLTDSCVDVSFTGCNFLTSHSTFSIYGNLIESTDYRNKDLNIRGNNFTLGRNAIFIFDSDNYGKYHKKVSISRNTFTNQSNSAIHAQITEGTLIYDNRFISEADYSIVAGLGRCIYMENSQKEDVYKPMIWNNIFNLQATGTSNALFLIGSDSVLVLHNTAYVKGTPIGIQKCSGTIANNLFHASTGNTVVWIYENDTAGLYMDHNSYFFDGLEEWQQAFHFMDPTSVEADPVFTDLVNLKPSSPFHNKTAQYNSYAHYDINGVSRNGGADMGAMQFDAVYKVPFDDTSACSGSTIKLDAGKGFDSYDWSNDSTGQTFTLVPELFVEGEENFYISASFRGNDYKDTVRVWLSMPVVDLGADISNCADDTAYLDAGPGFVDYDWWGVSQDGQQIFKTTVSIYTDNDWPVVVTDSFGCSATDTVLVQYNNLPQSISIGRADDSTLNSNVSDDVLQLQWYRDGEVITGATGDVYVFTVSGIYSLEGTTADGCSRMSDTLTANVVIDPTRVSSIESGFRLFPNPSRSKVYLEFPGAMGKSELILIDMNGRSMLRKQFKTVYANEKIELDVSGLPQGIYSLRFVSERGSMNKILIVQ